MGSYDSIRNICIIKEENKNLFKNANEKNKLLFNEEYEVKLPNIDEIINVNRLFI